MSDNVTIGIRLTADGKELVGAVELSTSELEKLGAATRRAGSEANNFNAKQKSLSSNIRTVARDLAGYWAAWKLGETVKDMALMNARHETLGIVMGVVGRNAGYARSEIEAYAKGVQKMGITMIESRQTVISMAQAQMDLANASKLARVAQDAAVIGGINSSEALNRLIHGIQTAQTDVLRTIGINVNFEESYKKLAQQLHKNSDSLSETEKAQARTNTVMEAGERIAGTYEAAMGTAGKQITSLQRYIDDLKVKFGEVFNDSLVASVDAVTGGLKDLNSKADEAAQNKEILKWSRDLALSMAALSDNVSNAYQAYKLLQTFVAGQAAKTALKHEGMSMNFRPGETPGSRNKRIEAELADVDKQLDAQYQAILSKEDQFTKRLQQQFAKRDADSRTVYGTGGKVVMQFADAEGKAMWQEQEDAIAAMNRPATAKTSYDGSKTAKESEFSRFKAQSAERMALLKAEANAESGLSDTQKWAIKMREDLLGKTSKLTAAQKLHVEATLKEAEAQDAANQSKEWARKASEDLAKAGQDEVTSIEKQVEAQRAHNEEIGLSREQVTELAASKLELAASANEEMAANMRAAANYAGPLHDAYVRHAKDLDTVAEKQRELASEKRAGSFREVQAEQARQTADEWKRTVENIDRTFHDGFVRMLENGKDGWKSFTNTLRNTFKSTVADAIYKMFAQPIVLRIVASMSGVLGMQGSAGASQFGGGGFGGMSGFGGIGDWFTNFGGSAGNMVAWAGSQLYEAGFQNAGAWLGENAGSIGNFMDVGGQALSYANAIMAARDGQWGKALGSAVGTYFGGPIGGAIGSTVGSWIDGAFGGGGGPKIGARGDFQMVNGALVNHAPWGNSGGDPLHIQDLVVQTFDKLRSVADQLDVSVSDAKIRLGYDLDPAGDAPGWINYGAGGTDVRFQVSGQDVKGGAAALQASADRAILLALQSSSLPQYLSTALNSVNAQTASQGDINAALSYASALKLVHDQLYEIRTPLEIARANIAEMGTTVESYTDDFKRAFEAGLTQDQLARWQALGATIAAVSAEDARLADAAKQIVDQQRGMEINLMELAGNAAGALAARRQEELDAMDSSLRPLQEQIHAVIDLNTAYDQASDAMRSMRLLTTDSFATLIDYTRYMALASNAGISGADANLAPAPDNTFMPGKTASSNANKELVESVDTLREDLKAGQIAQAQFLAEMTKILRRWNGDGMPEVRTV